MQQPTDEQWHRYYRGAAKCRSALGGDPLERYRERQLSVERRLVAAATVTMAALLAIFYFVLIR